MSAAMRLVKSSQGSGDSELPPIDRYEIWMRGRGLAVRTIEETVCTLRRLQRDAGYPVDAMPGLAISRFLAADQLGARARYTTTATSADSSAGSPTTTVPMRWPACRGPGCRAVCHGRSPPSSSATCSRYGSDARRG